jgi:hypothetical protein
MSGLVVSAMTVPEAQKLTERIRVTAHNYAEAREKLQAYVAEAKAGNAHLALGYASWTAYLSEVLGEEPMRLARGERQEMVQMLSAEGMSTRAIAPIVGASQMQVVRDIAGETNVSPAPVQGMDGKTYRRPEPKTEPAEPAKPKGNHEVTIVNDIRLFLKAMAQSKEVAKLPPHHKQHIIDALIETANTMKEEA